MSLVCLHALRSMGSCVDSRAWLIAIPDKIPPAMAPTELAVHWEWECVSSNWTVVSLMLLDPLRIQGCSPSCPASCFSPPKLCQGLVRELCSCYIPVLTLDQCCPLWLSHLHPGCTGNSLLFQQLQGAAQVCISVRFAAHLPRQSTGRMQRQGTMEGEKARETLLFWGSGNLGSIAMQVSLDSEVLCGFLSLSTTVSPRGNHAAGMLTALLQDCLSFNCHLPYTIQYSLWTGSDTSLSPQPPP